MCFLVVRCGQNLDLFATKHGNRSNQNLHVEWGFFFFFFFFGNVEIPQSHVEWGFSLSVIEFGGGIQSFVNNMPLGLVC